MAAVTLSAERCSISGRMDASAKANATDEERHENVGITGETWGFWRGCCATRARWLERAPKSRRRWLRSMCQPNDVQSRGDRTRRLKPTLQGLGNAKTLELCVICTTKCTICTGLCKNMHVMHMHKAPTGGETQYASDGRAIACGNGEPLKVAWRR